MANFADVEISYSDGKVKCEPDPVELHFNRPEGPDSVRWVLETALESDRLEITWKDESPFKTVTEDDSGHVVEGTDNTKVEGEYKYTVTIKNAQGVPVAVLDPRVRNMP